VIAVGGESLIDLVPDGDDTLAPLVPRLGGGPFNVAVATGRLGAPVAFLSRVSSDGYGAALLVRLAESGVDTTLVQRGPEPTTLALTGIAADGSAGYSFYVEGTADRFFADPGPLPERVTVLSLGTNSLVLEPGASGYESVLRRESARGVLTVLDPNIRPGLIADPDAYRRRFTAWLPHVGLLKLSTEDARWLAGDAAAADADDAENAVREWLQAGPAAVVLTDGGNGLTVHTARGAKATVPAAPANVVDTIGAGDTVHGALLAWLHATGVTSADAVRALDDETWRDALRRAAAAAAITVSRAGAHPPTATELDVKMAADM
jgi:fructokinase